MGRSIAIGLLAALLAATVVLFLFHTGPVVGGPVQYSPFAGMTFATVLIRALLWIPLQTSLPEELAFRGILLALLRRHHSDGNAGLLSAVPFALWHGVIVFHTIGQTSLNANDGSWLLGVVGGFAGIFIGGIAFAKLRLAAGNLAASFVAHWIFNATVLIGLYYLQHASGS